MLVIRAGLVLLLGVALCASLMARGVGIVFGNPKAGTPLMAAQPQSALHLPLKVLVSEAVPGRVTVSFNAASYIVERHSLPSALASNLLPPERLIATLLEHS